MTEIKGIEDSEPKYFYVDCRGVVLRIPFKYLKRIDKFKSDYDLSKSTNFTLDDFSEHTFNAYIDFLRDYEYCIEMTVPKDISYLYNYLNTDVTEATELLERKKEWEKQFEADVDYKLLLAFKRLLNDVETKSNDVVVQVTSYRCYNALKNVNIEKLRQVLRYHPIYAWYNSMSFDQSESDPDCKVLNITGRRVFHQKSKSKMFEDHKIVRLTWSEYYVA